MGTPRNQGLRPFPDVPDAFVEESIGNTKEDLIVVPNALNKVFLWTEHNLDVPDALHKVLHVLLHPSLLALLCQQRSLQRNHHFGLRENVNQKIKVKRAI